MYQIKNFQLIIDHIKSISYIFKDFDNENKEWFQIFCPFCDDATRKKNPSHGHCYISKKNIPYFKCFRCSESGNLTKLLIHTGFENTSELAKLKSHINFDLISNKKTYNFKKANNYEIISNQQDVDDDNKYRFYDYFNNRCNGISPEKFGIYPSIINNKLLMNFLNNEGDLILSRYIPPDDNGLRYLKYSNNKFYSFQPLQDITLKKNIIICEGAIDLINIYNFSSIFDNKKSFYIAINGNNYLPTLNEIVKKFLIIGEFNIHIIFDNDYNKIDKVISYSDKYTLSLNKKIKNNFYRPSFTKDVSELFSIDKI